jgi:hypothetical protein
MSLVGDPRAGIPAEGGLMQISGIDWLMSWFVVLAGAGLFVVLAVVILFVAAWCLIFKRAGYPWAFGIVTIVPIANVIAILLLAFSTWPVEREVERLRAMIPRYAPNAGAPVVPPPEHPDG